MNGIVRFICHPYLDGNECGEENSIRIAKQIWIYIISRFIFVGCEYKYGQMRIQIIFGSNSFIPLAI